MQSTFLRVVLCSLPLNLEFLLYKNENKLSYRRTNNAPFDKCQSWEQEQPLTSCGNITKNVHGIKVDLRLNVTNTKKNHTISTLFSYDFPDTLRNIYGKPYKIKELKVIMAGRTFVELAWASPSDLLFCIQYNSTSGEKKITTNKTSFMVQNLTAYTVYLFEVAYYKDFSDPTVPVGLPSDPAILIVGTSEDVAKYPPRVTDGSFTEEVLQSSKVRNITLYWQNFDAMNTNGLIIKYEVILNISGKTIRSYIINCSYCSQYTLPEISFNSSGFVAIKSGTSYGMSEKSTMIHISKYSDSRKPPNILLEILNEDQLTTVMMLSWKTQSETNVTGYTVYWCETSGTEGCKKQIYWVNVHSNSSKYNITNLDNNQNYLFGVSLETKDFSSGLKWERCYYKRNAEPMKPNPVQVQNTEPGEITVTWNRPSCDFSTPFIEYYVVFWCQVVKPGEDCTSIENSSIIFTSSSSVELEHTITHLDPLTRYAVWLQAVTSNGKHSMPGSKNYNATTKTVSISGQNESENQMEFILPIVAFAFSLLLICVIIQYRTKLQNVFCTSYEINVPVIKTYNISDISPEVPKKKDKINTSNMHTDENKNLENGQIYDGLLLDLSEYHEDKTSVTMFQTGNQQNPTVDFHTEKSDKNHHQTNLDYIWLEKNSVVINETSLEVKNDGYISSHEAQRTIQSVPILYSTTSPDYISNVNSLIMERIDSEQVSSNNESTFAIPNLDSAELNEMQTLCKSPNTGNASDEGTIEKNLSNETIVYRINASLLDTSCLTTVNQTVMPSQQMCLQKLENHTNEYVAQNMISDGFDQVCTKNSSGINIDSDEADGYIQHNMLPMVSKYSGVNTLASYEFPNEYISHVISGPVNKEYTKNSSGIIMDSDEADGYIQHNMLPMVSKCLAVNTSASYEFPNEYISHVISGPVNKEYTENSSGINMDSDEADGYIQHNMLPMVSKCSGVNTLASNEFPNEYISHVISGPVIKEYIQNSSGISTCSSQNDGYVPHSSLLVASNHTISGLDTIEGN